MSAELDDDLLGAEEAAALRRMKQRSLENSAALAELVAQFERLSRENAGRREVIEAMQKSFSWRITAPFRVLSNVIRALFRRALRK